MAAVCSAPCGRTAHAAVATVELGRPLRPAAAALGCRRRRRRCLAPAACALRVVATSEHWYEDEEEFDALTDAMSPKTVVLVCAPGGGAVDVEAVRAFLQPLTLHQAFSSQEALPFAQQLWAGRDKAPYFLKVRTREGLGVAGSGAAGAAAAAGVWQELLQQNWRVELDAGLGSAAPPAEGLLVVASAEAAWQLLAAAVPQGAPPLSSLAAGSVSALQVGGTQAGDPLDWQLLSKQLVLVGAAPAAGTTIDAALQAADVTAAAH